MSLIDAQERIDDKKAEEIRKYVIANKRISAAFEFNAIIALLDTRKAVIAKIEEEIASRRQKVWGRASSDRTASAAPSLANEMNGLALALKIVHNPKEDTIGDTER